MNRITRVAALALLFLGFVVSWCLAGSPKGSISGQVHKNSQTGPPLAGVSVTCGGKSDKTDNNGKFKVDDVSAGTQTVNFSKSGYESYQTRVDVVAKKKANLGDRYLTEKVPPVPPTGSLSGTVHKGSASGAKLSGASLTCGGKTAKTAGDGNFRLDNISAGNQTLTITKEGFSPYQMGVLIASGKKANVGDRWLAEVEPPHVSSGNDAIQKSGPIDLPSLKKVPYPGPGNRMYCYPQCVDFVRDVCSPRLSHAGNAYTFWTNPPAGYKTHANGSNTPPVAGDILVWKPIAANGQNGHVAIVRMVDLSKQELERTDANYAIDYLKDCNIRNHTMKVVKSDGKFTIVGSDAASLYGWISRK